MDESPARVLETECRTSDYSVSLRTVVGLAARCEQASLLPRPRSLWEALQKYRSDLAFLSVAMLQPDATITVRNSHKWAPDAVLIFLTDVADEGIVEKCLQEGATDYLAEGGYLARDPRICQACRVMRTEL